METIHVPASREYDVCIGPGLLQRLGALTAKLVQGRTAAIISDSNVWPIYGETAQKSLGAAGFAVLYFVFPAGENSKNGETFLEILNFLGENHLTRSDCLVALGGGVVGDLCGFAAATYLRGVAYVQVPTSLLAMVDSSVGGKTAIDLPAGKNLAGAFYQPSLVLCDTLTLNTLPPAVFIDGCGEVIKYGMLFDQGLFEALEAHGPAFPREQVIRRCVELKRDIVARDELDTGERMLLNFGHTLGHAIEKCSNYQISHGRAVAIGMAVLTRAHAPSLVGRLERVLRAFGLPTSTEYSVDELAEAILSDKKRNGGQITLILPATIGCAQRKTIPISQLKSIIKAGM